MSVNPTDIESSEDQQEVRNALISHCQLSDSQVESVTATMETTKLNFADAALRIGVITQNECDQTRKFVEMTAGQRRAGIVETAIGRSKPGRNLIVRHGSLVKPSKELVFNHDPDSERGERIRGLRTELMLMDDRPSQTNVLALVSPCAAEGRSLLAAELAISFSQLRRRVLLIDADLRHPRQHKLFDSKNDWGLTQALALRGAPRLAGVEGFPRLSILTAGPVSPGPLELVSDGRFARLVADCRYSFDDIIIDTPPISLYSDALSIATIAGRALVLSRAATTPKQEMKQMMRRLVSTQARVMGAVLSDF